MDKPKSIREQVARIICEDCGQEWSYRLQQADKIIATIYPLLAEIKTENFESFLRDKHAEQYIGTRDCMIDDFNHWAEYLGTDELIEYGNKFAGKIDALWRKYLQGRLK